jgi:hypothetical protein
VFSDAQADLNQSWTMDPQYVTPLLQEYDNNIAELTKSKQEAQVSPYTSHNPEFSRTTEPRADARHTAGIPWR